MPVRIFLPETTFVIRNFDGFGSFSENIRSRSLFQ